MIHYLLIVILFLQPRPIRAFFHAAFPFCLLAHFSYLLLSPFSHSSFGYHFLLIQWISRKVQLQYSFLAKDPFAVTIFKKVLCIPTFLILEIV